MATATDLQVLLPIIFDEIFADLSTNFDEANTGDDLVSILVHLGLLRRESVPRVTLFAEENVKNFTDWDFRFHFRLSLTTYNILLDKVSKIIEPDNPHGKAYIPAGKQILIFLWFMANTDSIRELSMLFGISKSTVHCTLRRIATAVDSLKAQLITWPTGQTRNCVIDGMAEKLGIQGCVGCVDGTHIRLAVVPNGDQDYVNRKGYPSLVLQVVVDDRMLITDSYVGWPGSTHDARVWRNSPLFQHIQIGRVMEADDFIIGDSAYPQNYHVVTPFRDNGALTQEQRYYNKRVSSCGQVVERAIGLLKCRFRRMKNLHCHSMEDACFFVSAACVLHNLCILSNEDTALFLDDDEQNIDPNQYPPLFVNNIAGVQRRNALVQQLWQQR